MNSFKNGYYGMYNGSLYRIGKRYETSAELCSDDRNDMDNGFVCNSSESFIKQYGFVCTKNVPKSEITEVYRIRSFADYKGFKLYIYKTNPDNTLTLLFPPMLSEYSEDECKIRDILVELGFYVFETDKTGHTYAKDISADDPEAEFYQTREEIDICKLSYEF